MPLFPSVASLHVELSVQDSVESLVLALSPILQRKHPFLKKLRSVMLTVGLSCLPYHVGELFVKRFLSFWCNWLLLNTELIGSADNCSLHFHFYGKFGKGKYFFLKYLNEYIHETNRVIWVYFEGKFLVINLITLHFIVLFRFSISSLIRETGSFEENLFLFFYAV